MPGLEGESITGQTPAVFPTGIHGQPYKEIIAEKERGIQERINETGRYSQYAYQNKAAKEAPMKKLSKLPLFLAMIFFGDHA